MSESASTILKNVFQFATILNQASNTDIQQWDSVSICNALDWADYCQELYQRLKGQHFEHDFNSHLAQMTMLLQPVSCLCLSLDALRQAKYLVVNTLICNPDLPRQLHAKLRSEIRKTKDGNSILSQIEEQMSRIKITEELHTSMIISLESDADVDIDRTKIGFQADFLVRHLICVVSTAKKKDRFKRYCHALCDKLSGSQTGNAIFVNMLKLRSDDVDPMDRVWFDQVITHLLSWVQGQVHTNPLTCSLVKAEARDLATCATVHPSFFLIYLEALSAWADSYVPELLGPRDLQWRSPTGDDYRALTAHFQCLLSALPSHDDRELRTKVIGLIMERVQAGSFTVWRSVATQLLILLKQG